MSFVTKLAIKLAIIKVNKLKTDLIVFVLSSYIKNNEKINIKIIQIYKNDLNSELKFNIGKSNYGSNHLNNFVEKIKSSSLYV